MGNTVSFNEFAKLIGVSTTAVQIAVKDGRLKKSIVIDENYKKPRLKPELAKSEWSKNTKFNKKPHSRSGVFLKKDNRIYVEDDDLTESNMVGSIVSKVLEDIVPSVYESADDIINDYDDVEKDYSPSQPSAKNPTKVITLNEAVRAKEEYSSKLVKLKYEKESLKLIDAETVEREAFNMARKIRDKLMGIPDRVSTEISGLSDSFQIHNILTTEIRNALNELASIKQV